MPSAFDKLRALAQRKLEEANQAANKSRPLVRHALNLVGVVNELIGPPAGSGAGTTPAPAAVKIVAKPAAPLQAPVSVYFDGKDHRTKTKVEELLRSRGIVYGARRSRLTGWDLVAAPAISRPRSRKD